VAAPSASVLASRPGKLILLLLCAVQFLDIADSSIMNVALPSIRRDLGFSVPNLQWVLSGYLITYGGLLLLGGRAGDLLGRRRLLVAGTALFAVCSLAGGLAVDAGMLVGARFGQGAGAALMAPAGLSILATTFNAGTDRNRALGVWGAISGLAGAAGVFLGGVLAQGPGWRWVLFVNLPVCGLILAGAGRLLPDDRQAARRAGFDIPGAVLGTGGMLALIAGLVRAPLQGWASPLTIGELVIAGVALAAFAVTEARRRDPLLPFSVLRITGLAAADATQMVAFAAFVSVFFFLTLYMQDILGYSPIRGGAAYLPVTAAIAVTAAVSARLFARTGTRPVILAGALIAAGGVWYVSRISVHGSYVVSLLPGLLIMAIGIGAVLVAVTTAANAGVPPDQAGLAAGLLSASQQLGTALGLAIFTAIATARTSSLLAAHAAPAVALTAGFQRALLACSIFLVGAAVIALRATNTRGEPPVADSRAAEQVARPDDQLSATNRRSSS
jgi:EmrB/QacA subfamily drug resistance transporter